MECPKCKSKELVIYEHQPLHTVQGMRIINDGNGNRYFASEDKYLDDELYAELKCTECGHIMKAKGEITFKLDD